MKRELYEYFFAVECMLGGEPESVELSKDEFMHAVVDAVDFLDGGLCVLCGVDTWEIHEYYSVRDELWAEFGAHTGMLCIGCLEGRLGRELVHSDFTDYPINTDAEDVSWVRSERLRSRLAVPSHLSVVPA